jgi:hypothetical protein
MTSGLSTSWTIDKRFGAVTSSTNEDSHFSTQSSDGEFASTTSFSPSIQSIAGSTATVPVRMINITFYINLDSFILFTDILDIYEGGADLKGKRLISIRGTDVSTLIGHSGTSIASINGTTYSSFLQSYNNLAVISIPVFAERATVNFQSRATKTLHFFAVYETSYNCPQQYFFNSVIGQCQFLDVKKSKKKNNYTLNKS